MKRIALATVAAISLAGAGQAQTPPDCLSIDPSANFTTEMMFSKDAQFAGNEVLDFGRIVPENGSNLCSILLDTTHGRIKLYFTTRWSLRGEVLVSRVAVREVPADMPSPQYVPPPPLGYALPTMPPPATAAAASFSTGRDQRLGWERFVASRVGDEHDGAVWWAGQRSLRYPGACSSGSSELFRRGCQEAQAILGPSDLLRKIDAAYRAGWNSL